MADKSIIIENTQCRLSRDAFHVSYVLDDDYREVQNNTHAESWSEDDLQDDQRQADWSVEIDEDMALLHHSSDDDGFSVQEHLSETSIFQLADALLSVAILMRNKRIQKEAEEAKRQADLDYMNQKLPLQ